MAKRASQTDHDAMVLILAEYLSREGYGSVRADLTGYAQPVRITWTATGQGHVPDVTATASDGSQVVAEVETDDSINDGHTADQWALFAAYASQHGAVFWVVVPVGSTARASRRLVELGLNATVKEVTL